MRSANLVDMTATARLDDVCGPRDFPVLVATARLLDQTHRPQMSQSIAKVLGLDQRDVAAALTNLSHRHLEVRDASTYGERGCYVVGIRPAGLEAVGQWPSPETAADRLIAALEALIDNTAEGSPKQSRLKAARDGLLGAGRDVLVEVAGAAITGRIPI